MNKFWFGSDISKRKFNSAFQRPSGKHGTCFQYSNAKGFDDYKKWALANTPEGMTPCFCMESTGDYGLALALYLVEQGFHVSVVNPAWIRFYALSKGRMNKTDKADAKLICDYAADNEPEAWDLADPDKRALFRLHRRRLQLMEMIGAESSRRECPDAIGPDCLASIKRMLKCLRTELREVEAQIIALIKSLPRFEAAGAVLDSLPRHGLSGFLAIVAEMPDVEDCSTAKSYAAAAGGNPTARQSGTTVSSSPMNRGGRRVARSILWMLAIGYLKVPEFRAFYDRLVARGKTHKQALMAVVRKLLMVVYGMLKSNTPYDPMKVASRARGT